MDNQEESREEWEKEIIDVQHSVTFPEGLRSVQIIAKKLSASPAPISNFAHLVRLLLSGVFLSGSFFVFSSEIPHKMALGLAVLAASCHLGISAFRRPNRRG